MGQQITLSGLAGGTWGRPPALPWGRAGLGRCLQDVCRKQPAPRWQDQDCQERFPRLGEYTRLLEQKQGPWERDALQGGGCLPMRVAKDPAELSGSACCNHFAHTKQGGESWRERGGLLFAPEFPTSTLLTFALELDARHLFVCGSPGLNAATVCAEWQMCNYPVLLSRSADLASSRDCARVDS